MVNNHNEETEEQMHSNIKNKLQMTLRDLS